MNSNVKLYREIWSFKRIEKNFVNLVVWKIFHLFIEVSIFDKMAIKFWTERDILILFSYFESRDTVYFNTSHGFFML